MPRRQQHTQPDTPEALESEPAPTKERSPILRAESLPVRLAGSHKRESEAIEKLKAKYAAERERYIEAEDDVVLKIVAAIPGSGVGVADLEVEPTEGSE